MGDEYESILAGSHLAAARLISRLEGRDPRGVALLKRLYPHTGKAFVIGITGPPGAGKSTLVDRLITELRGRGLKVGVLAVDPTSPYSGGALLGDRVRMQGHELDDGVFIRSMATRGRMGGLGKTTREAVMVLDAMGHEAVLIETVGVGQGEIDVKRVAHAVAVVSIPGMGDEIQAMKAGLMEIADVFVVNKADLPGAEDLVRLLEGMLHLRRQPESGWRPPVVETVAVRGRGVDRLADALFEFRRRAAESGELARRAAENERAFFRQLVAEKAAEAILGPGRHAEAVAALEAEVAGRRTDPYSAAEALLSRVLR